MHEEEAGLDVRCPSSLPGLRVKALELGQHRAPAEDSLWGRSPPPPTPPPPTPPPAGLFCRVWSRRKEENDN